MNEWTDYTIIYIYYVYSKWTRITLQGSCCMGHIFRRVKFWSDCTLPVQQSLNPERSHSTGAMVISGWFLGTKVHLGFFLVKPARDSWVNDQFIKISATISPDIPSMFGEFCLNPHGWLLSNILGSSTSGGNPVLEAGPLQQSKSRTSAALNNSSTLTGGWYMVRHTLW